jgi:hypothetical protein
LTRGESTRGTNGGTKRGRPTKLTPQTQAKIVELIRGGNYAEIAAAAAGIGERTFYSWMQRGEREEDSIYAEFRQVIKEAEAEAEIEAVAQVRAGGKGWQAPMTWLERKFPSRWARMTREQDAPDECQESERPDLSRLTDEELNTLEALFEKADSND